MITLVSMFRNSPPEQMDRYFTQVAGLPRDTRLVAVEGDSTDDTRARLVSHLKAWGGDFLFTICEHGGTLFSSVEDTTRYRQCAIVANAGLSLASNWWSPVVWVESDLIWRPETLLKLCAHLDTPGVDVVAPSIFMERLFYDVWGYRGMNGERFEWVVPFHPELKTNALTEMSSVGSCVAMRPEVCRDVRMPEADALVGFCRVAREQGYRLWLDWRLRVTHPDNGVRASNRRF